MRKTSPKDRYALLVGKYGFYFHDSINETDMSLREVLTTLNEFWRKINQPKVISPYPEIILGDDDLYVELPNGEKMSLDEWNKMGDKNDKNKGQY